MGYAAHVLTIGGRACTITSIRNVYKMLVNCCVNSNYFLARDEFSVFVMGFLKLEKVESSIKFGCGRTSRSVV